jgi:hypothetical protein
LTYLLDVNVLVALFDGSHVNHDAAHDWFAERGRRSWATCPITENGCLSVLSSPAYPSVQATPQEVIERLLRLCALPGHVFWADDSSLLDGSPDWRLRLTGAQPVTDFYLAALALAHQGRLATFDGSLLRSLRGTALADALELLRT